MDTFRDYRTNSTGWQRCMTMLLAPDETETTSPGLTKKTKDATKRSFLTATVAAALALLPLSFYGLFGAQGDGSVNPSSVEESADEELLQFNLVPAADAIGTCFPNASVKVRVMPSVDELGTDTFVRTVKRAAPNSTFSVFLTELPAAPFGAVQFLANVRTNAVGKGSVEIRGIIKDAFVSEPINGQRVRTDLNHLVIWFADPADAAECLAPGPVPQTSFDVDGEAGPSAFSSKDALPGAPLP